MDDLSGPEIAALLEDHIADMRAVSPPESKHALDLDGLRQPDITVWEGGRPEQRVHDQGVMTRGVDPLGTGTHRIRVIAVVSV